MRTQKQAENKVKAIELIDSRVMPIILDYLNTQDDYKVMVLPDHPTPIATRTHASDPVPYLIYCKGKELDSGVSSINEKTASETGNFIEEALRAYGSFS